MSTAKYSPAAIIVIAALASIATFAANVNQDENQTGSENWFQSSVWVNDAPASSGNDYFLVAPFDLRTPANSSPGTFGGDSLTVPTGTRFIAKHTHGTVAILPQLTLDGGQLFEGNSTTTGNQQTFEGNLTIASDSTVKLDGGGNRRMRYRNGTLSGPGALTFAGSGAGDSNDIFVFQGMTPVAHTGALIANGIRFITVGPDNDNIGDTAPVILQNGWYDMQNDETFGGLTGNTGSEWRLNNTSRAPTLKPQSDQSFAGTVSRNLSSLTIDGTATQTFDGVNLSVSNNVDVKNGTLALTGNGTTTVGNQLRISPDAGNDGSLVLSGGTAVVDRVLLTTDNSGFTGGKGTLNLNGGVFTARTIESGFGSSATLIVNGGTATVNEDLNLGQSVNGTTALNVSDGVLNVNRTVFLGNSRDATAKFTGGTVAITGDFRIAEESTSSVVVTHDAGDVSANRFVLARRGPATYNMNGGTLTSTNESWIALAGNGEFTQTGGDVVIGGNLNLTHGSESSGRTGTLNLNGGTFTTGGLVAGNGADIITMSGGTLRAGDSFSTPVPVTVLAGGGTLDTNGNDVSFTSGDFVVENDGTFTKTGAGAMTVTNGSLRIGNSPGGGDGTFVLEEGTLNVPSGQTETGRNGNGTLTIAGGTANLRNAFIGVDESAPYDATGTLNVSAGNLNFTQALNVGYRGNGILNVSGGTTVVDGDLRLSESDSNRPSTGTVTHSAGSVTVNRYVGARQPAANANYNLSGGDLIVNGEMWVGHNGPGTFTQTGGTVNAGVLRMTAGDATNGQAILNLNGGDFTAGTLVSGIGTSAIVNIGGGNATILGDLRLGQATNGTAALNVSSGTLAVNGTVYLGDTRNAAASFTGGTFDVTGDFRMAESSTSNVTVTHDAGDVTANRFVPARRAPTTYNMNGGTLTSNGDGWIALAGDGTFTQTGGDVVIGGNLFVTHGSESGGRTGTLNLNGGTFTVGDLVPGNGTEVVTMNGGTLRAGATFATPTDITLNAPNGGTFDSNGNTLTVAGDLSGAGGLTKVGTGEVVLTGNSSYAGAMTVNNGRLTVTDAGAFGSPSSINLGDNGTLDVTALAGGTGFSPGGATLTGTGRLDAAGGSVNLAGSTISPGMSPGEMEIVGNVTSLGSYDWQLLDTTTGIGTGWDHILLTDASGNPAGGGSVAFSSGDVVNVIGLLSDMPDVEGIPPTLDLMHTGNVSGPFTILTAAAGISDLSNLGLNQGFLGGYGDFALSLSPDTTQLLLTFTSSVPEPSTYALLGLMLVGILAYGKRRRESKA